MKTNIYILLSVLLLTLSGCEREAVEIKPIDRLSITVSYSSADFIDTCYKNKTITLSGKTNYTTTTNEQGVAVFENIIPGVYNVSVSEEVSKSEYPNMVEPPLENRTILVNGVLPNILAYESRDLSLKLKLGVKQSVLISKVYYATCKDNNNKNYSVDQYIELYNNSDQNFALKNLYMAFMETESTPYFYESRNEFVAAKDVFRLNDTILAPGASIVIARQAKDHTEFASASVNLLGADYETKAEKNQIWNSAVPGIEMAYKAYATIDYINLMVGGGNQIVLFNTDLNIADFEKIQKPNATASMAFYVKIPVGLVIDGVECLKYDSQNVDVSKKRLPEGIDGTYITTSSSSGRNNESLERRIEKWDGDRAVLMDTNNSINDFVVCTNPEPRNYRKSELQPAN